MLFIPLLILSIILYVIGHRVSSVLIFFFFCTGGFQIIPEPLFETFVGISKGIDFAFVYTIILFAYGLYRFDDFIPVNPLSKIILGYIILLLIIIGYSLFYYHIPLGEVIRTSRSFFIILSYFVIRRLDKAQFNKVVYALLGITIIQCVLYTIQALTAIPLMTEAVGGGSYFGFIHRYYNFPRYLYLFFFILFFSTVKVHYKPWIISILAVALILPLSRSAILIVILLLFIGVLLKMENLKRLIKYIPIFLLVLGGVGLIVAKQIQGRTLTDIQSVLAGEFIEVVESDDSEMEEGSTFIFRMALVFERYLDVIESDVSFFIGKGFCIDGSPYTNANFRYSIGLNVADRDGVDIGIAQLYSPDISWSNLILRYGIVGTIIYTLAFIYLAIIILRKRSNYSISLFLYAIFMLMNSISSDILFIPFNFIPFYFFFDKAYYLQTKRH